MFPRVRYFYHIFFDSSANFPTVARSFYHVFFDRSANFPSRTMSFHIFSACHIFTSALTFPLWQGLSTMSSLVEALIFVLGQSLSSNCRLRQFLRLRRTRRRRRRQQFFFEGTEREEGSWVEKKRSRATGSNAMAMISLALSSVSPLKF